MCSRAGAICQFCDTQFVGVDGDGGGKFETPEVLAAARSGDSFGEIARLYSRFRSETANFYDDDDLMEAAAGVIRQSPGNVHGVPLPPPSSRTSALP